MLGVRPEVWMSHFNDIRKGGNFQLLKKPHYIYFCDCGLDIPDKPILLTAQKMKFSIKDFFSKCDQTSSFLRIWSHLLNKSLMENFIFCVQCIIVDLINSLDILVLRNSQSRTFMIFASSNQEYGRLDLIDSTF